VLLGASGFLGRNLLRDWSRTDPELRVLAVSRDPRRAQGLAGPAGLAWEAYPGWLAGLDRMLTAGDPVTVIHLAAMADHGACERDPAAALEANCGTAVDAAEACRERSATFITVGTDAVFSGLPCSGEPAYWPVSQAVPEPAEVYGRTKLEAERRLAGLGWGHVLRLSFVGPSLGSGRGLVAYLARCLREPGQEVRGWVDNRFTPLPTRILSGWLLDLARSGPAGHSIRHWGSAPALTKYEFLERVAWKAGFRPRMIATRRADGFGLPLDQSLASEPRCSQEELLALAAEALAEELI
jgi:dTDP-4-dehydrorhamnose reductase